MSELTIEEIMQVLPHRYPMLMIDRIIECDNTSRVVALKNLSYDEPFLQGHFPGMPIMPGVLQLEAMAQTGGVLLTRLGGVGGRVPYLLSIDKAKFRRLVRPGDQLRIEAEMIKVRKTSARMKGVVRVDGEIASEAELFCMVTDQKAPL